LADFGKSLSACAGGEESDIQMNYMAQQTTVRFTDADLALLEALQAKTGIVSRTEVLRRAIRALAEQEKVIPPLRRLRKKGP
jgi:hypothetical protein